MLVGKRISGRYKILDVIGGGGMSNVYLAHDMILDRDVAIKILHYNFSNEQEMHRRFQREALSATSLTHPNIVSIYDVGEDGDMHYLVMEYVKGQTLKQYIQKYAPLAPTKCVNIMKQLTSAIAHAHQNQIIHRDIKPQNILMDEDDNVKITDFGIAMALEDTSFTRTNSVLGTVHYLSPEQARGGTATKKSDIYSLGIVLYELLTGELPFSGESAVAIALKHLQSETPSVRAIVPSIPQSLENVVLKATAKDPVHRYKSVEEMAEDLETVLSVERSQESKFRPPVDEDITKVIPVIKEHEIEDEQDLQKTKTMPIKEKGKEQFEGKTNKKKGKKKNKLLIFVGIIISLLFIFLIVLFLFPDLFDEKKLVVPDVTNQEVSKAISTLENAGFEIGKQTKQESEDVEENHVIGTTPDPGKERKKGTEIDLLISEGPKKVEFPNYVGQNIDQVKTILTKQGFKDINIDETFSEKNEGTILKQSPEEGEKVIPKDTTISFTVSKGVEQATVVNLLGYNENALNTYAKTSGFNIRISSEKYSDTVPKGQVISQSPKAGTTVNVGSTIEVVTSKGVQEKPVKTYVKSVKIPYEPEVDGEPQQVRIYIQDRTHSIADVEQEFQLFSTQVKRLQFEIEKGQRAIYRVVRDDKIIIDETISYDDLN
ncbi:Stk1 family PASTA domain-containing Ser/Thr kinase [Rummeliibacillus pycnus]|uniref:Stk1 family PASTA domain-containing Ser/Thr kinase n=1 Tax=Rummeliibacillus pycnus TaxID=101070 RepID=UPI000C9D04E6|nr:Stk1 family PASTA domain-containing Ser/Thr kinase [Rummeliibacillus pycnus]